MIGQRMRAAGRPAPAPTPSRQRCGSCGARLLVADMTCLCQVRAVPLTSTTGRPGGPAAVLAWRDQHRAARQLEQLQRAREGSC